jgi:hypothetical protein
MRRRRTPLNGKLFGDGHEVTRLDGLIREDDLERALRDVAGKADWGSFTSCSRDARE